MQSVTATSQVVLVSKFNKTTTSSATEYTKLQRRLYSFSFAMLERLPRRTSFSIKSSLSVRNEVVRKGEPTNQVKDGVIIVDHGSRRQESNLMELAEPSINDAFRRCVQQGANRVIVSPFFLLPGRHWYKDIPALVAEAAGDHFGISYLITAPLGLHELLVDVMNDRIKHCLSHAAGKADECSMCAGTGRCQLY